jgi:glycosyltransferase involved in cell wall biosynthesis
MDVFLYIDPNFNEDIGHYLTLRKNLLKECNDRQILFKHYVRKQIPKKTVEKYDLINVFTHKATINDSNLIKSNKIIKHFTNQFKLILEEATYPNNPYQFTAIYFYTSHPLHVLAMAKALNGYDIKPGSINIYTVLFYLNSNFLMGSNNNSYRVMLNQVSGALEKEDKNHIINLFMDSAVGINAYQPYFKRQINKLPIPVYSDIPSLPQTQPSDGVKPTIGYFGYATQKHAFDRLASFLNKLEDNNVFDKFNYILKIRDIIDPEFEDAFNEIVIKYKDKKNVDLILENLQHRDYFEKLNECDLVVIPYRKKYYTAQTSSLFVDALAHHKIVIVEKDTWMADQLNYYGSGEVFDSTIERDFYNAFYKLIHYFTAVILGTRIIYEMFNRLHCLHGNRF